MKKQVVYKLTMLTGIVLLCLAGSAHADFAEWVNGNVRNQMSAGMTLLFLVSAIGGAILILISLFIFGALKLGRAGQKMEDLGTPAPLWGILIGALCLSLAWVISMSQATATGDSSTDDTWQQLRDGSGDS